MSTPLLSHTVPTSDEKLWIVLCHLSMFIGLPFLLPLVVYLVKRGESPVVAEHAAEVLNFHISIILYSLLCIPLIFILIGFLLLFGLSIFSAICAIIAAVTASEGGFYRYPITIRFIN